MDDALLVSGVQSRGDLPDHVDHSLDGHVPHPAQAVVKILTFQIFHHEIRLAGFGLAEIDDVDKVRVAEA